MNCDTTSSQPVPTITPERRELARAQAVRRPPAPPERHPNADFARRLATAYDVTRDRRQDARSRRSVPKNPAINDEALLRERGIDSILQRSERKLSIAITPVKAAGHQQGGGPGSMER